MTELARPLEVTLSSLQQELESLVASGFLLRHRDGRRVYFKANTESPLFSELRGLVEKTGGTILDLKAAIFPVFTAPSAARAHSLVLMPLSISIWEETEKMMNHH
jgi:hypothetical protein